MAMFNLEFSFVVMSCSQFWKGDTKHAVLQAGRRLVRISTIWQGNGSGNFAFHSFFLVHDVSV